MASSITFTVWPTRRQFEAVVEGKDFRDYEEKYKLAHIEAARIAAEYLTEAYVTIEAAPQRCTFRASEYKYSQSIVRSIMSSGLYRAYWDFETRSWHPLPICLEADEGLIIIKLRLLPAPKAPFWPRA